MYVVDTISLYASQSFPANYATDMSSMAIMENVAKVVMGFGKEVGEEVLERTRALWEEAYDEPYDMAGSEVDEPAISAAREACYWGPAASEEDANRLYKNMQPRFLMEVCEPIQDFNISMAILAFNTAKVVCIS
jgi:hypothetical protein